MNQALISAFCAELPKVATATTEAVETSAELLKRLVKKHGRDIAVGGAGVAATLGAQRAFQDWKTGRQVRLQQSGGGY